MFGIELLIVAVAELLAEQFQVGSADEQDARFLGELHDGLVGKSLLCILVGLVEVAQTGNLHQPHAFLSFDGDVEVAHDEAGEVEPCHLVEQLVLVHRVGRVGDDEEELGVALVAQFSGRNRVAVAEHGGSPAPHIIEVEFTAVYALARFHAVHNHAGHLADAAVGIFLHHGVHGSQASLHVAVVQLAQSAYEDEFVAVGAQGESGVGDDHIGVHFLAAVGFKRLVGGGIERVFHVHAEA